MTNISVRAALNNKYYRYSKSNKGHYGKGSIPKDYKFQNEFKLLREAEDKILGGKDAYNNTANDKSTSGSMGSKGNGANNGYSRSHTA